MILMPGAIAHCNDELVCNHLSFISQNRSWTLHVFGTLRLLGSASLFILQTPPNEYLISFSRRSDLFKDQSNDIYKSIQLFYRMQGLICTCRYCHPVIFHRTAVGLCVVVVFFFMKHLAHRTLQTTSRRLLGTQSRCQGQQRLHHPVSVAPMVDISTPVRSFAAIST